MIVPMLQRFIATDRAFTKTRTRPKPQPDVPEAERSG
ncbi:DUF2274 domain-containing protein [Methylosinus sporium]